MIGFLLLLLLLQLRRWRILLQLGLSKPCIWNYVALQALIIDALLKLAAQRLKLLQDKSMRRIILLS
jgi:hypothetical protein